MRHLAAVLAPLAPSLARRARHPAARRATIEALRASAELAGAPPTLPCENWPRDAAGAPLAVAGWHASFADTSGLVVALVAPCPAAVDVEWLGRPRWHAARERFAEEGELARLRRDEVEERTADDTADDKEQVLALWTAKEALLKLRRVGLADLGRCSLVARRAADEIVLRHGGREHVVRLFAHGEHRLAFACDETCTLALHVMGRADGATVPGTLSPDSSGVLAGRDGMAGIRRERARHRNSVGSAGEHHSPRAEPRAP